MKVQLSVGDKVKFNSVAKRWFSDNYYINDFIKLKDMALTISNVDIIGGFPYCNVREYKGYWPGRFFKVCYPKKGNFIDLNMLILQ